MLESAKKILEKIVDKGYQAYIVGGFVRDYLLGIESKDIDITTNATPKQLQEIFKDACLPSTDYGAVIVNAYNERFEITTFRKEISYTSNRKPEKIEYIDNLLVDLERRDFTVNTICMNKEGEVIDFLKGKEDLENKIIKCVGDAREKFEQDCLRILRAIRFASTLGFDLDKGTKKAIKEKKHLLKKLSYNRKKEELDKMFSNVNSKKAIELLLHFKLDKELELKQLKKVRNTESLISIWSILNVVDIYPFTNTEKALINDINEALKCDNYDEVTLYRYDLYVNQTAGAIKNLDKKKITALYNGLEIHSRKDLEITSEDIMKIYNMPPGEYIKDIYEDIEEKVLHHRLENKHLQLVDYIKKNQKANAFKFSDNMVIY